MLAKIYKCKPISCAGELAMGWLPILITFLAPSKVQLYGFVVVTLSASP